MIVGISVSITKRVLLIAMLLKRHVGGNSNLSRSMSFPNHPKSSRWLHLTTSNRSGFALLKCCCSNLFRSISAEQTRVRNWDPSLPTSPDREKSSPARVVLHNNRCGGTTTLFAMPSGHAVRDSTLGVQIVTIIELSAVIW